MNLYKTNLRTDLISNLFCLKVKKFRTNQIEFCARPDKGDIGSDFTKESHAMIGLGKSDYAYGETKHLSLSPSKIVRKKYLAKR